MAAQTETRTIYGQAYIVENSLVQDMIFLVLSGKNVSRSENTVIVVEDIWEDLKSKTGTSKRDKNYWYWEVNMTDIEDPDHTVKVRVGCPKPGPEIFDYNYETSSDDSEWSIYWKGKMTEILDSPYNSKNAMSPEEVVLPGTKYVNQNGELVTLNEVKVSKNGLSDVQNLMISLF